MSEQYLKYLNIARENPSYFIPIIDQQIDSFVNERHMPLTEGVLYETNEGKVAWIEAKTFLQNQRPLHPFVKHPGLCKAASDHRTDLCENGIFGHRGSDGSTFSSRIVKYCKKGPGAMAEIIGADFAIKGRNTPQMTILGLIIDDGVPDRGHRKTVFSDIYRYVGWSSGKQDEKNITVFNLTENNYEQNYGGCNTSDAAFNHKIESSSASSKSQPKKVNRTSECDSRVGRDITNNNSSSSKPESKSNISTFICKNDNISDLSKFGVRKNKKVREKMENNKIYFEEGGAKVIQTTTKFIYNDGTVEENLQRRTIYIDP